MINFGKNIIHFLEDTLEFSCKFIKSSHVELVGEGVLHYDTKTAMRVTKFGSSFNIPLLLAESRRHIAQTSITCYTWNKSHLNIFEGLLIVLNIA